MLTDSGFNVRRTAGQRERGTDAGICGFRVFSTWAWPLNGEGVVDGRAEYMCKGRLDMARGTRTPQRGRCVSGMELTRKRHPVVGVLTDLSLRVPYQPNIGTETQRLKNRMKYLYVSLQCGIFSFFICTTRKYRVFSTPELGMEMTELLRHNVLLTRNWIFTMFCLCPNR
jgi:hypothetical protein